MQTRKLAPALACAALAACASHATQSTSTQALAAPGGNAEFARFVDDYFAARYAYSPSAGTRVGFHQYDAKLEDRSRARIEARLAEIKALQTRLGAFDEKTLSFDDSIDAAEIGSAIASEILSLETIRSWEVNPMMYASLPGNAVNNIMKRDFAPGPERLRSAIARLEK